MRALVSPEQILGLQQAAAAVPVAETIAAYITALCEDLRRMAGSEHSVSIRASLAVMQAARAHAFLEGTPAVHPDHVQAVFSAVMRHRVIAGRRGGSRAMDRRGSGENAGAVTGRSIGTRHRFASATTISTTMMAASTASVIFTQLLRIFAGHFPGVAVDDDLIGFRSVVISDEPDRDEDVLEGAALIERLDLEIAVGVSGDVARAEAVDHGVHLRLAGFRGLAEIDLIALDRPAADVGGIVGLEVGEGGEGLDFPQQRVAHADGAGHGVVIEEMGRGCPRWVPSGSCGPGGCGFCHRSRGRFR